MTGGSERPPPAHYDDRAAAAILRVLSPARAAIGTARLVFPALSLPGIDVDRLGAGGRKVVRVLGARQVAQAAVTGRTPTRAVLWLGAEIDVAHAVSMVALAVCSRRYQRAALGDAAVAATLAAAGAFAALNLRADPIAGTPPLVWRNRLAERLAALVVPGYPPSKRAQGKSEPSGGTIIGSDPRHRR